MATSMAELTRVEDLFQARLLKGFLESEGVRAFVPDEETIATLDGVAIIWGSGVRVTVAADDLERARELLAEWQRADREG